MISYKEYNLTSVEIVMFQMILFLPFILQDNCPSDSNAAQTDTDGDGVGDVCGKFHTIE